jgi:hypothetical protein
VPVVRVSDVVFIEIFPFLAFLEHLGEQLLRIGADAHAARSRKLNVQVAIRAAGRSAFPATAGVGFGCVQYFFDLCHVGFLF